MSTTAAFVELNLGTEYANTCDGERNGERNPVDTGGLGIGVARELVRARRPMPNDLVSD